MQLMPDDLDPGIGMTSRRTRDRLILRLKEAGITAPEVLEAIRGLPRHLFVDEALASRAYEDSALPIGHGQTISQPYTVARMTEALLEHARPDTVLEIGTGSGFQTAVLASLVRRVYSVERVQELLERAQSRLRSMKKRNIRFRHGDGAQGWREYAPYQGIMVTAAPRGVPRALAEQLAPGGVMVLPMGDGTKQMLVRLTRLERGFAHEVLETVSFVPLLNGIS
ncbi:protein-L-isoaspartate(D-aspartate) O-methyltransferase [Thiocystis violacea]|uniref:protein-L-isoaspartate(D-aspartate) O-methyltransferase n=1 Tax=Thiocystis violacea TaxID=13725 RepID=UPI00190680EF|nr:protein-L-isoaspartate(D-aspartate) O-methyltransferase [Thiocystis violacea]MBK1721363.1 protein-L-isoaspartate O-methyltransferase [Thiocystis violacea]